MLVALYARVSTARQAEKDLSIPDQLRQMRDWCKAKGFTVAREYVELGASATDDRRPVFQEMIADAMNSPAPYNSIIIHSLSRFFRDMIEFGIYERRLNKNSIKIISITQQTSEDPAGEMARRMFSLFDEYQSKENGKHTLRAMQENARQGYFNGSTPPYGYKTVEVDALGRRGQKKKLAVDLAEAAIVKRIFNIYIYGYKGRTPGFKGITEILNQLGITKRGNEWTRPRIYEVLQDTTYIGKHYFNKWDSKNKRMKPESEWILIPAPPILEESTFLLAQMRKKRNSFDVTPPMYVNSPTLLTGLIKCGKCGASMTLATGKSGQYKYYKCTSRINRHKEACSTRNIRMEELDSLVLESIGEKIFTAGRIKAIFEGLQKRFKGSDNSNARKIKELTRELDEIAVKQNRLFEAVENGVIQNNEMLMERSRKLQTRKQETLIEIAQLRRIEEIPLATIGERQIEAFCKGLKRRLKDVKTGLGKQYLKALIDEIRVVGDKILITGSYGKLAYAVAGAGNGEVPSPVLNWLPGPHAPKNHITLIINAVRTKQNQIIGI